jgi:hypothetical protein
MENRPQKNPGSGARPSECKHSARISEQEHINWSIKFILFHQKRHPKVMGPGDFQVFLSTYRGEENNFEKAVLF